MSPYDWGEGCNVAEVFLSPLRYQMRCWVELNSHIGIGHERVLNSWRRNRYPRRVNAIRVELIPFGSETTTLDCILVTIYKALSEFRILNLLCVDLRENLVTWTHLLREGYRNGIIWTRNLTLLKYENPQLTFRKSAYGFVVVLSEDDVQLKHTEMKKLTNWR